MVFSHFLYSNVWSLKDPKKMKMIIHNYFMI